MRSAKSRLRAAFTLTQRVSNRIRREMTRQFEKQLTMHATSFGPVCLHKMVAFSQRFSFLDANFISSLEVTSPGVAGLVLRQAETSLKHTFDLLGSGPTVVAYGIHCAGIHGTVYSPSDPPKVDSSGDWLVGRINRANLKEVQRIWGLIDPAYEPIDWQLDFKSGYRWCEKTWHRDIKFSHLPGVDVKVPWELGRMQHFPTLALACHFAANKFPGFLNEEVYAQEFRNQALDFFATNPPGFGVNWACAMDAAIRCVNLLIARDIIVASGVPLEEQFEGIFAASIVSHARHIVKNLEWLPAYRGNHYLANVLGLLFVAAYLPECKEVNSWLAFSVQEFFAEVDYQFHADGSNFEASVCYHRLSAEMVLWGCALISNLPAAKRLVLTQPHVHDFTKLPRMKLKPRTLHPVPHSDRGALVPPWCWERLLKMADFTQSMTRPDGMVVQFGDNDSGRFIKLCGGEQLRARNEPSSSFSWSLDHGGLVAGIRALLYTSEAATVEDDPGASLIRCFAGLGSTCPRVLLSRRDAAASAIGDEETWIHFLRQCESVPVKSRWVDSFQARHPGILDGIKREAYPGMGCYVFSGDRLYLAVRCGEIGVAGLGPHAHCDQLAIELVIDGKDHARDPGSYLYTPFPQMRNMYRSAKVHHVPHVEGREPANLFLGLFDLRGAAEGECLYFGPRGFIGRHFGYGVWVYRIVSLDSIGVTVRDFAEGSLALASSRPEPIPFSPGYGRARE